MFKIGNPTGRVAGTEAEVVPDDVTLNPATGQYEPALGGHAPEEGRLTSAEWRPRGDVPTSAKEIAVPRERPAITGVSGDWDERDFKFPTMAIVLGNGELKERFPEAAIVLGDAVLLQPPSRPNARPGDKFRFIPIGIAKAFKESVGAEAYAAGLRSRYADSVEEVRSMGGSTTFGPAGERPTWSPCATVTLIIEQPGEGVEGRDHPLFSIPIGDKLYTPPVRWYASGASFKVGASLIYSALSTILTRPVLDAEGKPQRNERGGILRESYLPLKFWEWRTELTPWGKHPQFAPKLQAKEETSAELREYCDSFTQG
jgi:hypothetical protein